MKFLFFDSLADSKAVLRADYDFLKNINAIKSKREAIEGMAGSQEIPEIYKKSIALEYFVRGKKKFQDLKFY